MAAMDSHDLYGLPLERFTVERNALAKALRSKGQRDEAARVTGMAKPSVAAWAVNQLVRTQRRDVKALFDAGDALQRAQSELVAGRADSATLRKASESERAAVDALAQKARGLLSSEGREPSPATLERVSDTLHAAALDEDARIRVGDGCLNQELRHVGLGSGGASRNAEPSRSRGGRRSSAKKEPSRSKAAERQRAERLEAARKVEAGARRELERSSRELETAERRRRRAAEALQEAEAGVGDARRRAEEASRAHERARRELGRA
jgi:hypothetical protein